MSKLAIIPARAGSKRIPNKNIIDFFGKPMISYAIETALNSKLFDEVMVSTDSVQIAEIAKKFGAKVPFIRSRKNASDDATTVDVINEVLNFYQNRGENYEYVCCIYPVTPLLTKQILISSFDLLLKRNSPVVLPAISYGHPIQRAFYVDTENKIESLDYTSIQNKTQDFKRAFHDAGQFYWIETNYIQENSNLLSNDATIFELSELEAHDVDETVDLELLKIKYKNKKLSRRGYPQTAYRQGILSSNNLLPVNKIKFEPSYKSLKENIIEINEYKLVPIRYEDRYKIMDWRNEQLYHLRQEKPLSKIEQDNYFENVILDLFHQNKPNQLLFSLLNENQLIGYGGLVHINWKDRHAEISFVMNTSLESEKFNFLWSVYLKLIEKVAFNELKFNKLYVYAYDLRPHLYPVLKSNGYTFEARLEQHIIFQDSYKDVIIHKKLNTNE